MSSELITIVGVGVTLAGLILYGQNNLKADLQLQRQEVRAEFRVQQQAINDLRQRMARLQGLLEGQADSMVDSL
ncbi:MAG: hypothetical protein OXD47_10165 [Gammaproteobacteria bacterium]|nr:hypothetical protein [Gammaproteobacteria bacterium]